MHSALSQPNTMDTPDKSFYLLEIVTALRSSLAQESHAVTSKLEAIVKELEDVLTLEDIPPKPVSMAECNDWFDKLKLKHSDIDTRYQLEKKEVDAKLERQSKLLITMSKEMKRQWGERKKTGDLDPRLLKLSIESLDAIKLDLERARLTQDHVLKVENQRQLLVQTNLFKFMKNQNENVKLCFYKLHLAEYASHLENKSGGNLRPATVLDSSQNRSDSRFPPEIMLMLYSFCDVETCVALRGVNSGWFSAFNQIEPLFKGMLKYRNPWIKPGDGDLITWTDCALVFVARIKSSKWKCTTGTGGDSLYTGVEPPRRKAVVASELKLGERLPGNFKSLIQDGGCEAKLCRHFHANHQEEKIGITGLHARIELTMDMWSGDTKETSPWYRELDHLSNETEAVILHKGVLITLPGSVDFEETVYLNIFFTWITAQIKNQIWVMPRDKPHYKHGVFFDGYTTAAEDIPGILDLGKPDSHDRFHVDVETQQFLPLHWMSWDNRDLPLAWYNGTIWWAYGQKFVPSFVDMQQPEKTYYRPDRVITGLRARSECIQGDKSLGLGRYILMGAGKGTSTVDLVDLESRCVTSITPPHGWERDRSHRFFLGFTEGQFHARYMNPDTVDSTRTKILTDWAR